MGIKVSWNQEKKCVGSMNAESSSCPTIISCSSLSKSVPMISRYGHQMCSVLLWGTWLEKQAETTEGYLSSELGAACRSQIIDLDRYRGSGHRSWKCTVNPQNFFFVLFCQPFYISREFPFFLLCSSVAQTLKNVGPLDCKFRLLRRRSLLSLGGKISVAEVMHLLTLNVFAANFRVVLVVVTFFFLFLCGEFEHFFSFFLVEIVSESTLIETSCARQPHGASISSLPSSPRATAPESWIFWWPQCSSPSKTGSTAPRPAWCSWKKKPELEGCLQT